MDNPQALNSLQTDSSWRKDGFKSEAATSPAAGAAAAATAAGIAKPGALILIDIKTVNPTWLDGKKEGRVQSINVRFNSLDVTANQVQFNSIPLNP